MPELQRLLQTALVLSTQARYCSFVPSRDMDEDERRDEETRANVDALGQAVRWRIGVIQRNINLDEHGGGGGDGGDEDGAVPTGQTGPSQGVNDSGPIGTPTTARQPPSSQNSANSNMRRAPSMAARGSSGFRRSRGVVGGWWTSGSISGSAEPGTAFDPNFGSSGAPPPISGLSSNLDNPAQRYNPDPRVSGRTQGYRYDSQSKSDPDAEQDGDGDGDGALAQGYYSAQDGFGQDDTDPEQPPSRLGLQGRYRGSSTRGGDSEEDDDELEDDSTTPGQSYAFAPGPTLIATTATATATVGVTATS